MQRIMFRVALVATMMMGSVAAFGGELDPNAPLAPQGLIVREDALGNREVFKAGFAQAVTDSQTAERAVADYIKSENLVANVRQGGELDQTTSQEAWYCWYNPYYSYGYYYSNSWYGSYYSYYPSYNYWYGGYNYSYYYWY